jgi:hypothetical protein
MKITSMAMPCLFALAIASGCGSREAEKPKETKPQAVTKPQSEPAPKKETPEKKEEGWVRIYADKNYKGRSVVIKYPRSVRDLETLKFNDVCSSVTFEVPDGWRAVLYEDKSYAKKGVPLRGKGSRRDLGKLNDKCSSIRWEK